MLKYSSFLFGGILYKTVADLEISSFDKKNDDEFIYMMDHCQLVYNLKTKTVYMFSSHDHCEHLKENVKKAQSFIDKNSVTVF